MRSGKSWSQGSDSPVGQSVTGSRSALANSSILWACPSPASGPDGSGCGAQQRPPVRLQLDHHQTMGVAEPSCSSAKCFYYYSPLGDNYEKKQQQEVKKKEKQRTERRQTCSTCGPPSLSSRAGTPAPADTQRSKAALWSPLGRV
ncbi:hypothetical protein EXN66_Car009927 [Channa argus]|uniref:Uncharacterized protein n=1 Tax=Channa argus TaxID=215402 RepID=A0A6G1PV85_CHAAH|nr:hypothetical protein EXN66_Car009927 [Channa argus]